MYHQHRQYLTCHQNSGPSRKILAQTLNHTITVEQALVQDILVAKM